MRRTPARGGRGYDSRSRAAPVTTRTSVLACVAGTVGDDIPGPDRTALRHPCAADPAYRGGEEGRVRRHRGRDRAPAPHGNRPASHAVLGTSRGPGSNGPRPRTIRRGRVTTGASVMAGPGRGAEGGLARGSRGTITRWCAGASRTCGKSRASSSWSVRRATAAEALARVPAVKPQVAVLDVRLPDGNGVTLCRELRSRMPQLRGNPVGDHADDGAAQVAVDAVCVSHLGDDRVRGPAACADDGQQQSRTRRRGGR